MNITHIRVTRGRTINMGNYESERVEISLEAAVTVVLDSSELDHAYALLATECEDMLKAETTTIKGGRR